MSGVAQRYGLSPGDRDVADRILRRRVSEEAISRVVKRMGAAFAAHMTARLRSLSPEFELTFETGRRAPKPAAGSAECAGFALHYRQERCRLILHLDRAGSSLLNNALLGADPEMELPAASGSVSQLEIGVLRSVAQAVSRTRKSDRPLLAFDGVDVHRGDDPALAGTGGDTVATLAFSLAFGVNRVACWLDVPHRLLIELSAQLTAIEAQAARGRERAGFNMPDFALDVDVVLALEELTLRQIALLRPGDVIEGAASGGAAIVRAKGRDLFAGQIGRLGQANAARVTGPIAPLTAALEAHAQQHASKRG